MLRVLESESSLWCIKMSFWCIYWITCFCWTLRSNLSLCLNQGPFATWWESYQCFFCGQHSHCSSPVVISTGWPIFLRTSCFHLPLSGSRTLTIHFTPSSHSRAQMGCQSMPVCRKVTLLCHRLVKQRCFKIFLHVLVENQVLVYSSNVIRAKGI